MLRGGDVRLNTETPKSRNKQKRTRYIKLLTILVFVKKTYQEYKTPHYAGFSISSRPVYSGASSPHLAELYWL